MQKKQKEMSSTDENWEGAERLRLNLPGEWIPWQGGESPAQSGRPKRNHRVSFRLPLRSAAMYTKKGIPPPRGPI